MLRVKGEDRLCSAPKEITRRGDGQSDFSMAGEMPPKSWNQVPPKPLRPLLASELDTICHNQST